MSFLRDLLDALSLKGSTRADVTAAHDALEKDYNNSRDEESKTREE